MAVCRISENIHKHIPVLLHEAVDNLITDKNGFYVDATFGRGSHSKAILDKLSISGRLIAFDKDPEAISYANKHFAADNRFSIVHASFAAMEKTLVDLNLMGKMTGILFDLGVSSPQLDDASRGFSFARDGKLDMRMDTTSGVDAATWIAKIDEEALANIIYNYGDEKFSRRIARAIVEKRAEQPITTTGQLADIISHAMPRKPKDKHPATRSFQAIRI